jgi:hypothetical protein
VGFHRGTADGALRSAARRTSSEYESQHPSGCRAPFSTGAGTWSSSEPRAPIPTRLESPAQGVGPPGQPGATERSSSEPRAVCLVGTGQAELFGAPPVRFHGSGNPQLFGAAGTPAHPGLRNRSSSEPRARRLTGSGRRHSSEGREPSLTGTRAAALFGVQQAGSTLAREASPQRDRAIGAPRSAERPSHGMSPSPHRGRASALFGGPRPASWDPSTGTLRSVDRQVPKRVPHSSERGALGARQSELFGAPGAGPHRGNATRALRSPGRGASSGPGQQRSSERGQPVPSGQGHRPSSEERQPSLKGAGSSGTNGAWHTALFGGSRAAPRPGTPRLELFGAPGAASHRDRVSSSSEPGRSVSPGADAHLIGKPVTRALRGQGWSVTRGQGLLLVYASHLGGGAVGKDTGSRRRPCRAGR